MVLVTNLVQRWEQVVALGTIKAISARVNSGIFTCPLDTDLNRSFLGIDAIQQSIIGQSGTKPGQEASSGTEQAPHEAAVDKMHPEQVSEYMRDKYKSTTAEQDRENKEMKKR